MPFYRHSIEKIEENSFQNCTRNELISLIHHLDPGLEPVDKGHLLSSVVLGYFLGTYEECSRFYFMGIHGVKCKLLETEIKNCKDKEFFKFSTCNEFISLTMICFIAGMLSFGLLQNNLWEYIDSIMGKDL